MTTTLETVSGVQARIYHLPGRPPFLLTADLAEMYGTSSKRITEQVKRNPARFPDRYAFRLTEAEEEQMIAHFAASFGKKRHDLRLLVFTHGGANMLSGVLKSPVADEAAVVINDAFTEMEQRAISDAKRMVLKLQTDVLAKKPIYARIAAYVEAGSTFEALWRDTNYSRAKLEQAAREMLAMRLIAHLPAGLQPDLFANV